MKQMCQVVCLLLAALPPGAKAGVDRSSVDETVVANAGALDPIKVSWTRRRESRLALQSLMATIKYGRIDHSFLELESATYSYQNHMFRVHRLFSAVRLKTDESTFVGLTPNEIEYSGNGECFFIGSGQVLPKRKMLTISGFSTLVEQTPDQHVFHTDYLEAAGFAFPVTISEQRAGLQSLAAKLLKRAEANTVSIRAVTDRGARCVELSLVAEVPRYITLGPRHRFVLDLDKHYAVRQHDELSKDDRLMARTVCDSFQKLPGKDCWLPKQCRTEYFSWPRMKGEVSDQPLFVQSFVLTSLENSPLPLEFFDLSREYNAPGTMVGDARLLPRAKGSFPGQEFVEYVVPAQPEDLDRVIQRALNKQDTPVGRTTFWYWFVGINLALGLIVALWWVFRGRAVRGRVN